MNLVVGPTPFTLVDILAKDVVPGDLDFLLIPGGSGVDAILLEENSGLLSALWTLASQYASLVCTISEGSLLIGRRCSHVAWPKGNDTQVVDIESNQKRRSCKCYNGNWILGGFPHTQAK